MIETTAHWGYYAQANVLASRWIETSLSVQDPNAILTFADAQVKASGNWLVAQLLEKSLESGGWQDNRLAGQVLRCKALRRLREGILKPESLKNQRARSEAAWVVASVGVDDLTKTLKRGLIAARRTLADLGNLSKKHETLRGQLIEIETSLGDPNTP